MFCDGGGTRDVEIMLQMRILFRLIYLSWRDKDSFSPTMKQVKPDIKVWD